MIYSTDIILQTKEYNRINNLLSISDFNELSCREMREIGAKEDTYEGIFEATFDDGGILTYDLCSGNTNYYDNMVFTDVNKESYVLECDFELGNKIEFQVNNNKYIININLV